MLKNQLLALDIGTRSVVGMIMKPIGNQKYQVIDYALIEHSERAMLDGQIHDIGKVTNAVEYVVNTLSKTHGRIEQAAIAAAGRALRTQRAKADMTLDITKEVDKSMTDQLEMLAIQTAQDLLAVKDQDSSSYYSVGHSVIDFKLDDALILNPIGHRGHKLTVEIIATFLPHIVVDSLYTVLHKADLDVLNLTLEPIAAFNVAIPKNLRLLNLALVDIGAGTSDIAISKDGTIASYGMVASAGDKITERIASELLLDFNAAEALKIQASKERHCKYKDVLGLVHDIESTEVFEMVDEVTDILAQQITDQILTLNGRAPSAVFCIGGGSQLPNLRDKIAEKLELSMERVAVKTIEQLEQVIFEKEGLSGPEFITPIGIGVTAFEENDHDFIQVSVNDTSIRVLNTKNLQVSDALLMTGFNARTLLSERGESIIVTVDGEDVEIKGNYGEPAKIMINGELVSLDTNIGNKDKITVLPAEKGKPKKMKLSELVNTEDVIYFGDAKIKLAEYIAVNGVNRTGSYVLISGDQIEVKGIKTVNDLLLLHELNPVQYEITQQGARCPLTQKLVKNKRYSFQKKDDEQKNGELPPSQAKGIMVTVNEQTISVGVDAVFVDVFEQINFDTTKQNGVLELLLNGERANYLDPLHEGDVIIIKWR